VRLAYFGTPAEAVPPLEAVLDAGHDVALVVTQPDRRRGRGSGSTPSPVRAAAEARGLPVRTPTRAAELADELGTLDLDLGVVVAFGQLLPVPVLTTTRSGFVNLHFSRLPRWRGAAPVERAILAGDTDTAVCVMVLDEGMDTGPVLAETVTAIGAEETAGELRARLVTLGAPLLVAVLADLAARSPQPQTGPATHAAKLAVEEFALDWARPAADLVRVVRAGNPRPGAWTTVGDRRLKVLRARVGPGPETGSAADPGVDPGAPPGTVTPSGAVVTGSGTLELLEVQPEGRAPMPAPAWRAGLRGAAVRLGEPARP
jgi:methionyl-tRNA formyltransferase